MSRVVGAYQFWPPVLLTFRLNEFFWHTNGVILIDPPLVPWRGRLWSHLASDHSYAELHDFAADLGIPRRGFDRDHYDLPAEYYDYALAAGAVPVRSRELVQRLIIAGLRIRKPQPSAPQSARLWMPAAASSRLG